MFCGGLWCLVPPFPGVLIQGINVPLLTVSEEHSEELVLVFGKARCS